MADIIRLRGSPHEQTQELLPWYINGTLDAGETAAIEAHLAECAECRADLAAERAIARELVSLSLETGQGWAAMSAMLDAAEARTEPAPEADTPLPRLRAGPGRNAANDRVRFWQRRVDVGWLAGASAVAASLALVIALGGPVGPPVQTYHALGAAPVAMPANVVVMFQPATREADLRAMLLTVHAQLVGGPTASGGYLLHVAPGSRAADIETLRATPQVTLAEPIDVASLESRNGNEAATPPQPAR